MFHYSAHHPLRQFFSGLAEHTFVADLGVADPPLIDYLSELLSRFISMDAIHKFQASGRTLEQVADMLLEAEAMPPEGRTYREVHRHIGDFTLFWTGVYPEALRRLKAAPRMDHFIDYCRQGKRSYYLAACEDDPYKEESRVLRRLSEEYELCAYGLTQVRKEWEHAGRPS
jgi:hypothetical protein